MAGATWSRGRRGLLVAWSLLILPGISAAADWPQFRGPSRDGRSAETELAHNFPETGPTVLWRVPLGEGYSGVTISDGRLFTLFSDEEGEFAGSCVAGAHGADAPAEGGAPFVGVAGDVDAGE